MNKFMVRNNKSYPVKIAKHLMILALCMAICFVSQPSYIAHAAGSDMKSLCSEVLKVTGNKNKLKYKSEKATDFAGFSIADCKKVSSIMYVCDDKEVYSLCVAKAKNAKGASKLLKSLKSYKKANANSDYLSDYSKQEQKVLKNSVCGKKGSYVWYIAMSGSKSVNKKGQSALKNKI